ncbi:MAG: lipid II flippase MurJ [Patescibacteria group bacterium]
MVRRFLNFFQRELTGLHEAAFLLGLSALLSQILALLRDRLLAASFGAGPALDVYYAAFRVPDLLYVSLGSFVSVTVVLPFLIKQLESDRPESASHLLADLFSRFLVLITLAALAAYFLMPHLLGWIAPGFNYAQQRELLPLSRLLLLSPILLGLSSLFANVTQSSRKFFLYALSPIFYNLGIIFGVIFLYPSWGLTGLVWGVLLGALGHLAIQWPALRRGPITFRWSAIWRHRSGEPGIWRKIFLLSWPRTITLSANQLVVTILLSFGSYLAVGSIAIFNFAYHLQSTIVAIIGVSYSVATFPTLVRLFSAGDRRAFVNQMTTTIRHIIFWSLPAIVLAIVLRAQIVRVILGAGKFDWGDTRLTAAAMAVFLVSATAQSLILLFVRGYYACGQTKKPLIINLSSSILTVGLALGLQRLFNWWPAAKFGLAHFLRVGDLPGVELLILPTAFTLGTLINLLILWGSFLFDFGSFPTKLHRSLGQSSAAALVAGGGAYLVLQLLALVVDQTTFFGIFIQGFSAGLVGILIGAIVLWRFNNEEIIEIGRSLRQKFWRRARPILSVTEEL